MRPSSSALDEAADRAPNAPGTYFLFDSCGVLVYVGKATSLRSRIREHARAAAAKRTLRDRLRDELVTEVRWEVHADAGAAAAREADVIVAFRPDLNGSHRDDGRWAYLAVHEVGPSHLRIALDRAEPSTGRIYGSFPHLGVGVASERGIACSDGFTALLRLLWASGEADERAMVPAVIGGDSPPREVEIVIAVGLDQRLHRFLGGTGGRLIDDLQHAIERRPAWMRPALRRDLTGARAFYEHGPRALHDLRLRRSHRSRLTSRDDFITLLYGDVSDSIGSFTLPDAARVARVPGAPAIP